MPTVIKDNFLDESNDLIQRLPSAAYVSIDLQLTGVEIPSSSRPNKFEQPPERYNQMKVIPERYSIMQLGIAIFHENPEFRLFSDRVSSLRDGQLHQGDRCREGIEQSSNPEIGRAYMNDLMQDIEIMKQLELAMPIKRHESSDLDHIDKLNTIYYETTSSEKQSNENNNNAHENLNLFPELSRQNQRNRGFSIVEPPEFLVRKYTFFLLPSSSSITTETNGFVNGSREIVMNPSSIAFLNDRGIDFNDWVSNGIPYTTVDKARHALNNFRREYNDMQDNKKFLELESSLESRIWPDPTDSQDVSLIARTMASLREWIDSAADQSPLKRRLGDDLSLAEEERLGIVKIIHMPKKESVKDCLKRKIKFEYPSLHWDKHNGTIEHVLVRLNNNEKKIRDERRQKFAWRKVLSEKIGFTRVFKALSDACRGELGQIEGLKSEYEDFLQCDQTNFAVSNLSQKSITTHEELTRRASNRKRRVPIIVHNGFIDFLFLLSHFHHHKLPEKYADAKELINHYFPVVHDTKVLASQFCDLSMQSRNTSLNDLYNRFVIGTTLEENDIFFSDEIPHNHTPTLRALNESSITQMHDAGDGAFKIGAIFQCLCRRIKYIDFLKEASSVSERRIGEKMICQMSQAKECRVGTMLFLDDNHPDSKLSAPLFGLNQVFMQQSIFNIDLEAIFDPLKSCYKMTSIFRVVHPNRRVTLDFINSIIKSIRCNENTNRGHNQKIQYEIGLTAQWFIVAARSRITRTENGTHGESYLERLPILDRRSKLLHKALKKEFPEPGNEIISLEDVLRGTTSAWSSIRWTKPRGNSQENKDNIEIRKGVLARFLQTIGIQGDEETGNSNLLRISHRKKRRFW